MKRYGILGLAAVAVASLAFGRTVSADSVGFIGTGTDGAVNLGASVFFSLTGTTLTVTLTNTGTSTIATTNDALGAVFWNYVSQPTLTPVSAVIAPGSGAFNGTAPAAGVGYVAGDISDQWAYMAGLPVTVTLPATSAAPQPIGISAVAYGTGGGASLFGPPSSPTDLFSTDAARRLDPGDASAPPDGSGAMILPSVQPSVTVPTDKLGNASTVAFVQNSMVFTFTTSPSFSVNSINNVVFQYSTDLTGIHSTPLTVSSAPPVPVPLPATAGAGLCLLAGFAVMQASRKGLRRKGAAA
jgi:hypothetical protein